MSSFTKRIISGIVYVCLFLSAILLSKETYIALITIFSAISLWEFAKIIKAKNIIPYIFIILLSIAVFINSKILIPNLIAILLGYTIFNLTILLINLFSKELKKRSTLSSVFLQIKYVVFPFFFLILLPFINGTYHPNIIIYIILIIWTNDSFAFLVGKNFGKHKLFERISPKKTIEGFIGGLLFSVILGCFIGYYTNNFSVFNWIIIAIIVAVFGSLGDLVESKFKREAKVKDSGTIMPGHGGILDRLDSLFFLAPFVYLYIHFLL